LAGPADADSRQAAPKGPVGPYPNGKAFTTLIQARRHLRASQGNAGELFTGRLRGENPARGWGAGHECMPAAR